MNPQHQIGTYALPESQLDRFLMRISLGYPDHAAERALLHGDDRRHLLRAMQPSLTPQALAALQQQVRGVHVSDALLDYLQALVAHSREAPCWQNGLSPRAALALLQASRAWALLEGREMVFPEDVQAVLPAVVGHRLQLRQDSNQTPAAAVQAMLHDVAIP